MHSTDVLVAGNVELVTLQLEVMREIRRQLTPYHSGETPITGETVISSGLAVDSLTIMDLIMELEDRFDVTIPMNVVAEIRTIDQLAQTVLNLHTQR
ncbi:MAG: acyl carrier protein [Reyranella sp.]|uniref:acyl carrier protein n=1 Tax=Reyranella sp. TaxID=1929291 RepID=UPI003D13B564